MAVKVYNPNKSGDYVFVEPSSLHAHLSAGWSLEDPTKPQPEVISSPPKTEPSKEEEAEDAAVLKEMGIEIVNPTPEKPKRRRGRPRKVKT